MALEWIFEKTPPMGGAAGQAFNNPLVGQEDPPTLLARESIQNSCDASFPDTKVRVNFRIRELMETRRGNFSSRLASLAILSPGWRSWA